MSTTPTVVGAIADDVTGATDVAAAFRRQGLHTELWFGLPDTYPDLGPRDAVVIALKTRTIDPSDAIAQTRHAATWLREHGATHIYFKYCSTFDSTPHGNIGPVLDALAADLDADTVLNTPSSPEHGRTQYAGQLFVHGVPLAESPMRNHPLTPMTDSSLVRLLEAQSTHKAAVLPYEAVAAGPESARNSLQHSHAHYVLADALTDGDLQTIGRIALDSPLSAGAAGLAGGIASVIAQTRPAATADTNEAPAGRAAVLAGSCSSRTLEQIAAVQAAGRPAYRLDALRCQDPHQLATDALAWFDAQPADPAALIYCSLPPDQLRDVQQKLGTDRSATIFETAMGLIARGLRDRGANRIIAAGGETSGAVVAALGVTGGTVGPEPARGVPWITTADGLHLLLKSGNFGDRDLLVAASETEPAGSLS